MVKIETFNNMNDAFYWLETFVEDAKLKGEVEIKGEVELLDNGHWRVGVSTDYRQLELDV